MLANPSICPDKIDVMQRTFIWTDNHERSKKSPVTWKQVCNPKRQRGQNVFSLAVWNKVTMLKCLWNLSRKALVGTCLLSKGCGCYGR